MSKNYDLAYADTEDIVVKGKVLDEEDIEELDEVIRELEHDIAASNIKVAVRWGKNWTGTQHGWNIYPQFAVSFTTDSFSSDDLYSFDKNHHVDEWEVQLDHIKETRRLYLDLNLVERPVLKVTLEL